MPPIQHILFPFDFSNQAMQVAPFVRAFAERFDAAVTVIGVVQPAWVPTTGEMPILVEVDSVQQEKELRSRLDRSLHRELVGIRVERVTAVGDPAGKIVEYAHEHAVDLIMMPTHGFGIFRSMLLGSVTAKVLHDAKCPVWTAAHAEEQRAPIHPKTIACAIDGPTEETQALVRWASEFSHQMKASLKLLHVVPPVSEWLAIPTEIDLHHQLREEARTQLEDYLKKQVDVTLPVRVIIGKVAETIAEEAHQEGVDLVITGRGTSQAPLSRLRSHVFGIVQQSHCPVLSV